MPTSQELKIYAEGEQIGPYEVIKPLGIGGFSAVYLARPVEELVELARRRNVAPPEAVAVKICKYDARKLPPELLRAIALRLEREYATLERFDHSNIVRVWHPGWHEGAPYYVMDALDGIPLSTALAKRPTLRDIVLVLGHVAGALGALHERSICHRDITPENIVVLKEGGEPFLIDLGICQPLTAPAISGAGDFLGTLPYLSDTYAAYLLGSPASRYLATPSDDVFGYGVILYEVLTGRSPWSTPPANRLALLMEIRDKTPKHPRELNPDAPPNIADVAMECLSHDLEVRPRYGLEVLDRLQKAWEADKSHQFKRIPRRRVSPLPLSGQEPESLRRTEPPAQERATGGPEFRPGEGRRPRQEASDLRRVIGLALMGVLVLVLVCKPGLDGGGQQAVGEVFGSPGRLEWELTDGGVELDAYRMPPGPLKGQKLPPCDPQRSEVEKNGGCWAAFEKTPGTKCPDEWVEEGGMCYWPVPAKRSHKPGTSGQ